MNKQFLKLSNTRWLNRGGGNIVKAVDVPDDGSDPYMAIEFNFPSPDPEFAHELHIEILTDSERLLMIDWLDENSVDLVKKYIGEAPKFDIGVRVKVLEQTSIHANMVGVIDQIDPPEDLLPYRVFFDETQRHEWFEERSIVPVTTVSEQPAFKFAVGQRVNITSKERDFFGRTGKVELINEYDPELPYRVRFSSKPADFGDYSEDELVLVTEEPADDSAAPKFMGKRVKVVRAEYAFEDKYVGRIGIASLPEPSDLYPGEIIYDVKLDDWDEPVAMTTRQLELVTDSPPVLDEATGEPHFCANEGCEQPAANFDSDDNQWYCNRHYIPF